MSGNSGSNSSIGRGATPEQTTSLWNLVGPSLSEHTRQSVQSDPSATDESILDAWLRTDGGLIAWDISRRQLLRRVGKYRRKVQPVASDEGRRAIEETARKQSSQEEAAGRDTQPPAKDSVAPPRPWTRFGGSLSQHTKQRVAADPHTSDWAVVEGWLRTKTGKKAKAAGVSDAQLVRRVRTYRKRMPGQSKRRYDSFVPDFSSPTYDSISPWMPHLLEFVIGSYDVTELPSNDEIIKAWRRTVDDATWKSFGIKSADRPETRDRHTALKETSPLHEYARHRFRFDLEISSDVIVNGWLNTAAGREVRDTADRRDLRRRVDRYRFNYVRHRRKKRSSDVVTDAEPWAGVSPESVIDAIRALVRHIATMITAGENKRNEDLLDEWRTLVKNGALDRMPRADLLTYIRNVRKMAYAKYSSPGRKTAVTTMHAETSPRPSVKRRLPPDEWRWHDT